MGLAAESRSWPRPRPRPRRRAHVPPRSHPPEVGQAEERSGWPQQGETLIKISSKFIFLSVILSFFFSIFVPCSLPSCRFLPLQYLIFTLTPSLSISPSLSLSLSPLSSLFPLSWSQLLEVKNCREGRLWKRTQIGKEIWKVDWNLNETPGEDRFR